MNIGLALMVGLSLLPVGLAQAWASVDQGLWFARSAEFLQQPAIERLRWLRVVGDTVFTIGAVAFAWFMAGLFFGWSYERTPQTVLMPAGAARREA
jgi:nitric oxide reductase subunit B